MAKSGDQCGARQFATFQTWSRKHGQDAREVCAVSSLSLSAGRAGFGWSGHVAMVFARERGTVARRAPATIPHLSMSCSLPRVSAVALLWSLLRHLAYPLSIAVFCSKKSAKSTKKSGDGKRRKRRIESFSSYIYKVLKQVHPGTAAVPRLPAAFCCNCTASCTVCAAWAAGVCVVPSDSPSF